MNIDVENNFFHFGMQLNKKRQHLDFDILERFWFTFGIYGGNPKEYALTLIRWEKGTLYLGEVKFSRFLIQIAIDII